MRLYQRYGVIAVLVVLIVILLYRSHQLLKFAPDAPEGCNCLDRDKAFDHGLDDRLSEQRKAFYPSGHLLQTDAVPNNVLFVWCGQRLFEFNHYLSVRSVINTFKPHNIWFLYDFEPAIDKMTYNTWFKELQEEYPFFEVVPPSEDEVLPRCLGFKKPNSQFIYDFLSVHGGLYLNEEVIIDHFPLPLRRKDLVFALGDVEIGKSFPLLQTKMNVSVLVPFSHYDWEEIACASTTTYESETVFPCVKVEDSLYPKDIWRSEKKLGKLARRHFYGTEDMPHASPADTNLVPNIAHMAWIVAGVEMDFLFFLGVLSLIYVAEVDMVYIHGVAPIGFYWETLKDHPKVKLIHREASHKVYNQDVRIISHVSDIWRVDIMVQYGGLYIDSDVIFVRPLDDNIRRYDAVACYDWVDWTRPYPNILNFGVTLGKRGAKFWKKFQESMKWFLTDDFSWVGLRQPYRLLERNPDLIRIDPHLSVICYNFKCHPTWYPDFGNESLHHENSHTISSDWKADTYSFHFTVPTPLELSNETALLQSSKTLFAEIGLHVLQKANILQPDGKTLIFPNGYRKVVVGLTV